MPHDRAEVWAQLRSPRWLILTVVVVAASVGFGFASHWQYQRAVAQVDAQQAAASVPVPLADLVPTQGEVPSASLGRMAEVSGEYVADAWVVNRAAPDGTPGVWLVSALDDGSGILTAVLRGWLPTAQSPGNQTVGVQGRVSSDENFYTDVAAPGPDELVAITNEGLAQIWQQPVRPGYVVLVAQEPVLTAADPVPVPAVFGTQSGGGFPWQNAGYAVQWLVFIGFAGFMYVKWFRDDLDRAREDRAELVAAAPRT